MHQRPFSISQFLCWPVLLLLTACAASPQTLPTTPGVSWPTTGWRTSSPESQSMDSAKLDQMAREIDEKKIPIKSVLVIRHGFIVAEKNQFPATKNTTYELYSCTKSFTSTLVGIMVDQGLLKLEQPVLSFFPDKTFENVDERKKAMTVENLLTMTSGLEWNEGDRVYQEMYTSADWVKYVLDKPMAAQPGTQVVYNSGSSHVLSAIVGQAAGMPTLEFARKYLFEPLGIKNPTWTWNADSQGNPIGGWGLQLSTRDMAKLGYLFLHEGQWDGRQIVSAEWVKNATTDRMPNKAVGEDGYGFQWWTIGDKGYAAQGRYGQIIYVHPELDLVVVMTAQLDNSAPEWDLINQYIIPACQ
jgi:CubicO group peptidase (beta-lactamase class C family)